MRSESGRSLGKFRSGKGSIGIVIFTMLSVVFVGGFSAWWLFSERQGPLENLPDDGWLAPKAGSGPYSSEDLAAMPADSELQIEGVVAPDESLSASTKFELGETKRVGNLEITPVGIEKRTLWTYEETAPEDKIETGPVLVLKLRVNNVSKGQTFAPLDPAFLYPDPARQMQSNDLFDGRGMTYTFLHPVGRFDEVICPFDLNHRNGWKLEGQVFPELGPGETADLIVVSDADAGEELSPDMVWRVKLRKGLTASGRGVASVVGVSFSPEDVQPSP